jgi:hypothetical protein
MKRIPSAPLRATAMATTRNKWNYRGVVEIRHRYYHATVGNRAQRSKFFSTPAAAARAYDAMARKRYGKLAFLNFPKPGTGERKVKPLDKDFCARGHERALHTYYRPSGAVGYCRLCNKLAQMRSKERRRT